MNGKGALAVLGALSVAVAAWSQSPAPLALTGAAVLDGRSAELQRDVTVVVENGVIQAIGSDVAIPAAARMIDLEGRVLLPGLIDGHVHVSTSRQAEKALRSGITTLRSMGVSHYADVGLRELRRSGAIEIPQILAAGYHVRPSPAEGMFLDEPSLSDLIGGASSADDFRRLTHANLERGVDWIKINATERAGLPQTDPRKQTLREVDVSAIVEEAVRQGIPVAAHAHGDEGGRAAVAGGVRSIEHGTYLSRQTLELMRDRGTFLVPTVAIVTDLESPGGDYDEPALMVRGRHMLPRLREVVRTAHELGVPIVAATDTGFAPDSTITLQHEIEELTRCGLSAHEAIQAATVTAAKLLGLEQQIGAVAVGLEADLIVVDRNPLEDIRWLQDVLLVINDGRVVVDRIDFALGKGRLPRSR